MTNILTINAGSSSIKCALYQLATLSDEQAVPSLWSATFDYPIVAPLQILVQTTADSYQLAIDETNLDEILTGVFKTIWEGKAAVLADKQEIAAVGHRVVHGGDRYSDSTVIDQSVEAAIEKLEEFAPLHNALSLACIRIARKLLQEAVHVAVFDTAFHTSLPAAVAHYPIPRDWTEKLKIKRYGFHGISHEYVAARAAMLLQRPLSNLKIVTAHLGNGCSLAAVQQGVSVDTTMGFTPLDGLMMGTRSGAVDPGIILYLLRDGMETVASLEHALNHSSGLLGVSGVSNDMRRLLAAAAAGDSHCQLALDMFVDRLSKYIAAMFVTMSGADVIVFTGGIGEHAAFIRQKVCDKLAFLGVRLDAQLNQHAAKDMIISSAGSAPAVLVVESQEQWSIARHCLRRLQRLSSDS